MDPVAIEALEEKLCDSITRNENVSIIQTGKNFQSDFQGKITILNRTAATDQGEIEGLEIGASQFKIIVPADKNNLCIESDEAGEVYHMMLDKDVQISFIF